MSREQQGQPFPGNPPAEPAVEVQLAGQSGCDAIENLLQLYLHELSAFGSREAGEDGRYPYPYLPLYWSEQGRWPFLLRVDGNVAGFALVRQVEGRFQMAEFYVLREYRRCGVGERAARLLFAQFPGLWLVEELAANTAAIAFWRAVIGRFAGVFKERQGPSGLQQLFDSAAPVHQLCRTGHGQ
ncbi:MAG: GNAT family N-acetyltransferase [Dehalococcoidia bacterium]|nr:GNAT family N-acetyltransferase [Chloroflexi bacterium CFX7]MCK6564014.1 GNAT family N-acetyltransferase [Dehalococcoidia bacterium]NUQ55387.1 GNAT family N-acetyltransferase [Dehalococcoidia bacterium]RIL01707.1 MAG: GNAT family N-acetyltransferase [bacterium]